MKNNYLLASRDNSWSDALNEKLNSIKNCNFDRVRTKRELKEYLQINDPQKIFFFHWSNIVAASVFDKYECIVFHTANLPEFRGGSPIQNQIVKNVTSSHVNALKMTAEVDGGPIYCSEPLTLQGTLYDVWHAISTITFSLIEKVINHPALKPVEQKKGGMVYNRLKNNSVPFEVNELNTIYRFIQMLDADEYPNASLNIGNFVLYFTRAKRNKDNILCDVKISRVENE